MRTNPMAVNEQQTKNTPDSQNRRALGDISNQVTVRGAYVNLLNHPARAFWALLFGNAKAESAADQNNKPFGGLAPMAVNGAAAAQNKIVEISPDTEEEALKEARKKHHNKKIVNSLTSFFSARSKAAWIKPEDDVVDIDAADADNELAAVEYVEDLYKFYKVLEEEIRVNDYIESQPEINRKMRSILVDWLIELHHKFKLLPETLYLTVNILDRFLSVKSVPRRDLKLVGISALFMASKYEDIWSPLVDDFVCISGRAYSHDQIIEMEKTILGHLEGTLTVATTYVFLVRFIKASIADEEMEQMAHFLSELGLLHYEVAVMFRPSQVAASAVYAARCTLKKTPAWDATLQLHTGFTEAQLLDCAELLTGFHATAAAAGNDLKVVYSKYSSRKRAAVALVPAGTVPSTC